MASVANDTRVYETIGVLLARLGDIPLDRIRLCPGRGRLRHDLRSKMRGGTATRLDRLSQWRNESDYHGEMSIDLPLAVESALAEYVFSSSPPPQKGWRRAAESDSARLLFRIHAVHLSTLAIAGKR